LCNACNLLDGSAMSPWKTAHAYLHDIDGTRIELAKLVSSRVAL